VVSHHIKFHTKLVAIYTFGSRQGPKKLIYTGIASVLLSGPIYDVWTRKGQIIIEIYTGDSMWSCSLVAIYDVWITYAQKRISTGKGNDSGLERTNPTVGFAYLSEPLHHFYTMKALFNVALTILVPVIPHMTCT